MLFCKKNKNNTPDTNKEKLPEIFSLAPKQDLAPTDLAGLEEYEKFLSSAFAKPDIRNILIAGKFGSGKSSIIRSFENHWSQTQKQKTKKKVQGGFLYISLGDYLDLPDNENQTAQQAEIKVSDRVENSQNSSKSSDEIAHHKHAPNDKNEQNVLERRLLLQIYARFHHTDLPATSFKLIQEHNNYTTWIIPLFCAFTTLSLLTLGFHEPLGQLVSSNFSNLVGAECVSVLKSWGHLALYVLVIILLSFATFVVVQNQLPRFQAKSLTFKADSLEAQYENAACESYLDQHTTELIYCLERISEKIRNTVVFEDMDRLDSKTCLEIFTRLREINYLANLRITQNGQEPLRFIYVANDSIIAQLDNSKFFDYILPIYPRMNQRTAETIFTDKFNELCKYNGDNISPFEAECGGFIHSVAGYLSDYRIQHTILNDYSLLFRIYKTSRKESNTENINIQIRILALAIYKNCFPSDFAKLWEGKSEFFPNYKADAFDQAAQQLLHYLRPFLTPQVLYYVGFNRKEIVDLWEKRLKSDLDATLQNKISQDSEFWSALEELCKNTIVNLPKNELLGMDTKGNEMSVGDLVKMIQHMISNGYKNWNWLFKNENVSAITAISTLACITCTTVEGRKELDDQTVEALFNLVRFDPNGTESIFESCSGFEGMGLSRDLSDLEVRVLVRGTGKKYNGNCVFRDSSGDKLLRECVKYK